MLRQLGLIVSLALVTTGCFYDDDDDEPPFGTLVLDWTVEGTKSPGACRANGVDTIDIVIRSGGGRFVDELLEYCETFEVAIDLLPGSYAVDAVLLDFEGFELTTTVTDRLNVYAFDVTVSAVDFPSDSFL